MEKNTKKLRGMTPPNDFATRLEGLIESIRTEPNALKRFGLVQQQDALLANHAPAISRLARAAEHVLYGMKTPLTPENIPAIMDEIAANLQTLEAALAALNAEDKP